MAPHSSPGALQVSGKPEDQTFIWKDFIYTPLKQKSGGVLRYWFHISGYSEDSSS